MVKNIVHQLICVNKTCPAALRRFIITLMIVGSSVLLSSINYEWMTTGYQFISHHIFSGFHSTYGPGLESSADLMKAKSIINFSTVGKSFDPRINYAMTYDLDAVSFKELLLKNIPDSIAKRMAPYLPIVFKYSQHYKLDPLWVLSIIWVESHFKKGATSPVRAAGLMQLMPGTGRYLNDLLRVSLPTHVSHQVNYDPRRNIELGTFYLSKLLKRFRGNHIYATVAYNMGPTYTVRRLRAKRPVGSRNRYLRRVKKAYAKLSYPLRRYLRTVDPAYTKTYVYASRPLVSFKSHLHIASAR